MALCISEVEGAANMLADWRKINNRVRRCRTVPHCRNRQPGNLPKAVSEWRQLMPEFSLWVGLRHERLRQGRQWHGLAVQAELLVGEHRLGTDAPALALQKILANPAIEQG